MELATQKRKAPVGVRVAVAVVATVIIFGPIVAFVGGELGWWRPKPTAPVPTAVKQQITPSDADAIVAEYEANELRADSRFKGKTMVVRGQIADVGRDVLNKPYVVLVTPGQRSVRPVQCSFPAERAGDLVSLNKGQSLLVRGVVQGLAINVQLNDCEIETP